MRRRKSRRAPPVTIRSGSVEVKIYSSRRGSYTSHTVAYYHGGSRHRKVLADAKEAREEARRIADLLAAGRADIIELAGPEREAYAAAVRSVKPTGVPLHVAAEEYAAAKTVLGDVPLLSAAKDYVARHAKVARQIRTDALVKECLAAKEADGLSRVYLHTLKSDLGRFSATFKKNIADLRAEEMSPWLRALPGAPRTRNNMRRSICTLFHFARSHGYLPKHLPTEADDLPKAKEVPGEEAVFTPDQMRQILGAANGEQIVWLTLGGFAGLRSSEIERLDWQSIDIQSGYIKIVAAKTKKSRRRLVPILPNLAAWLQPYRKTTGRVLGDQEIWKDVTAMGKRIGLGWPRNVLRNSFISYRLAQTHDIARVAEEAGTSPAVIRTNYLELVTPADATKWFGVMPLLQVPD